MKDKFIGMDIPTNTFCEIIKAALVQSPDSTFVAQAWDGEELKAFLIAVDVLLHNHVFVFQAWKSNDAPLEVSDRIFFHLLAWADSLGKNEIRAETQRDTKAFYRRWRFEPYATILSFKVPQDFYLFNLGFDRDSLVKETSNVGRIESINTINQQTEQRAAVGVEADIGTTEREDGNDSDPNSVGDCCPPDSRDAGSSVEVEPILRDE